MKRFLFAGVCVAVTTIVVTARWWVPNFLHSEWVPPSQTPASVTPALTEGENVSYGPAFTMLEDWEEDVFGKAGACAPSELDTECLQRRIAFLQAPPDVSSVIFSNTFDREYVGQVAGGGKLIEEASGIRTHIVSDPNGMLKGIPDGMWIGIGGVSDWLGDGLGLRVCGVRTADQTVISHTGACAQKGRIGR